MRYPLFITLTITNKNKQMKKITGNDPTPRQFVKDMLPDHYEVKETITGVIRCKSSEGIEGAEDWANFMNAVKKYFGDAFKEVITCHNHINFTVYYSYINLHNLTPQYQLVNQQLPVEVAKEIEKRAMEVYPFKQGYDTSISGNTRLIDINTNNRCTWMDGATEYATKLHHAKELLSAVHRSPDNGNTDDVLNRKIQKFLYGE